MFDEEILKKTTAGIRQEDLLTPQVISDLSEHATQQYPKECIGYIKDGAYHPLENAADNPEAMASLTKEGWAKLVVEVQPDAVCHSHPDGPDCPSAGDMVAQRSMDIPFVIVSTNGKDCLPPWAWGDVMEQPPLMGRAFRHGVHDCYDLIRAFYRIAMGVELEDYPRDWEWWSQPDAESLYEQNFKKWGFVEMQGELQFGDVFLLKAGARVVNHAGVFLGNGLMIHHLSGRMEADASRISTIEPIIRWQQNQRLGKVLRLGG